MSDQKYDSTPIYNRGPAGTISGFTLAQGGEEKISVAMLYDAIRQIKKQMEGDYNPATLRDLVRQHIADTNNPHHDKFSQLGFDIAHDLAGSILPGTVPSQPPSYALDPLCLLPITSLPSALDLSNYSNDVTPVITSGTDEKANDSTLIWLDENRNAISIDDFNNKKSPFGYSVVPTTLTGTGQLGLLNIASMTIFTPVDTSTVNTDPKTSVNYYTWAIKADEVKPGDRYLPTLLVPIGVDDTNKREITMLWYSLVNMILNGQPYIYVIFTAPDGSKLVVQYKNSQTDYITVDVVYKKGFIEPVFKTDYGIGGVRFLGAQKDILRIQWTCEAASDWSNYTESDISMGSTQTSMVLPSLYLMKFLYGNPGNLLGTLRDTVKVTPLGLMLSTPKEDGHTTTSLSWKFPALSSITNIGMFNLCVTMTPSVDENTSGTVIFRSDTLTIALSVFNDGDTPSTLWDITLTDGTNTTHAAIGGSSRYIHSIALSSDGVKLRVRVSGSDGVTQLPTTVKLDNLPNSQTGEFSGAILNLETYSIPDDGSTLDFLIGDVNTAR